MTLRTIHTWILDYVKSYENNNDCLIIEFSEVALATRNRSGQLYNSQSAPKKETYEIIRIYTGVQKDSCIYSSNNF